MRRFAFSLRNFAEKATSQELKHWYPNVSNPLRNGRAGSYKNNIFARFLAHLGPEAAKELCHLEFYAADRDILATNLPLVTSLLEAHLPGLISLRIYVCEAAPDRSDSPDYWHPDTSSPFWMNGEFWPMYKALEHLVDRVGWLRDLSYSGQENFGSVDNEKPNGNELLARLEKRVQQRKGLGVRWKAVQTQEQIEGIDYGVETTSPPALVAAANENSGDQNETKGDDPEIEDLLDIMGAGGIL